MRQPPGHGPRRRIASRRSWSRRLRPITLVPTSRRRQTGHGRPRSADHTRADEPPCTKLCIPRRADEPPCTKPCIACHADVPRHASALHGCLHFLDVCDRRGRFFFSRVLALHQHPFPHRRPYLTRDLSLQVLDHHPGLCPTDARASGYVSASPADTGDQTAFRDGKTHQTQPKATAPVPHSGS